MLELAASPTASREMNRLRTRLAEVEETLSAIRTGAVDAIAVDGPRGRQIFTLEGADQPYRILAEQMSEGTASMGEDGTILFCNKRLAAMVGRKPQKLVGSPARNLVPVSDGDAFRALFGRATGVEHRSEIRFLRSDNTLIPVLASVKTLPPVSGHKFCLVATDLSAVKRAEAEKAQISFRLEETNRLMNAIVDHSSDLIVVCNAEGTLEYVSPACAAILGKGSQELEGETVTSIVDPEDASALLDLVRQPNDQHRSIILRCRGVRGSTVWMDTSKTILQTPSHDAGRIVVTFHDVTEHRLHQQEIQNTLEEKEVLLREIYHRVKNNLQVIQSLLKMQARALGDDGIQQALAEMAQRVHAMALVHERLYQRQDLTGLSLPDYLRDLFNGAVASQSLNPDHVLLAVDVEEIHLSLEQAVPFGLLMNELICNSLKHGFSDGRHGIIRISIHRNQGCTHFQISDDGIGLPSGFDLPSVSSMGLQVARSLAHQLGGQLAFSSQNGCCVQADFTRL